MRRTSTLPPSEVPFDEIDFLVIDVETTGLSANAGDRICELGIIQLHGGEIIDSYGTLINPRRLISPGAFAVNKITPEMIEQAPSFSSIAPELQRRMNNCVLVAYNAHFDISFLRTEFLQAGLSPFRNNVVDALILARQLLPGLNKYSQDYVSGIMGIPAPVKHRALEDAKTTAMLFQLFLTMLKAYGCGTLNDIRRNNLRSILHARRLTIIQHALRVKSNLWIKYLSSSDNRITERLITPLECVNEPNPPYAGDAIIAFCRTTGEQQKFHIDQILDLRFIHPFTQ